MQAFSRRVLTPSLLVLLVLAAGCAGKTGQAYRDAAAGLAASAHMTPVTFDAGTLRLAGYLRCDPSAGKTLTVYIEGDGHAFARRDAPSADPTPADPLGLILAARDPHRDVLYLARPGQYLPPGELAACNPLWWTLARYSPEVIAATNRALDQAKARCRADTLRLVGYSGGGALAVLVAAGRDDVVSLTTLAANLDTDAWTALHGVTPLVLSRNPADVAADVARIPQTHYVGAKDTVTPPSLCRRFLARMPTGAPARCVVLPDAGHHAGLADAWTRIVKDEEADGR
jgi:pimeloyl-ACP methyl ester carboxylesterase